MYIYLLDTVNDTVKITVPYICLLNIKRKEFSLFV